MQFGTVAYNCHSEKKFKNQFPYSLAGVPIGSGRDSDDTYPVRTSPRYPVQTG